MEIHRCQVAAGADLPEGIGRGNFWRVADIVPLTSAAGTAAATPAPTEIVVFITHQQGKCAECGLDLFKGNWIRLVREKPLCLECADLAHLEFLPRGDVALTRRATKHAALRAVVVQWSRARQHYERQGILVPAAAIQRAEEECLADADRRARQRERAAVARAAQEPGRVAAFAAAIGAAYPGCPAAEAARIAERACEKYSGRVGRSAAARELDPEAVRLAVVAHIRHTHTNYDALLMRHDDRALARQQVQPEIARILARWQLAQAG
ncbi:MAG: DUF2293 domain-containing protein [Opitutae bacterium]|nr:DUF2293 domain-containing protein [Opitutae bacterium]